MELIEKINNKMNEKGLSNKPANKPANEPANEPVKKPGYKFKTWKKIKIGTGLKTGNDFCHALYKNGITISRCASYFLKNLAFSVANEETEIDIIKVSVNELGFKNGASIYEIYACAEKLGLKPLTFEAALQLRLNYLNQPIGKRVGIAINPIIDFNKKLRILSMYRGTRSTRTWLCTDERGYHNALWNANDQLVFWLPRKSKIIPRN